MPLTAVPGGPLSWRDGPVVVLVLVVPPCASRSAAIELKLPSKIPYKHVPKYESKSTLPDFVPANALGEYPKFGKSALAPAAYLDSDSVFFFYLW